MSDKLTVEEQIKLLELGIEANILTEEDLARLREMGILSDDSSDKPVDNS